jgi:hypothetical protein
MNLLRQLPSLVLVFLLSSCVSNNPQISAITIKPAPAVQAFPYAFAKENPVEVCKPAGEREYLSRLSCESGNKPTFKRVRSVGSRNEFPKDLPDAKARTLLDRVLSGAKLEPGEVDYHVIDEYEVMCGDKKATLYMDMYHCHSQPANAAPGGFSLKSLATKTESKVVSLVLEQLRQSVGATEFVQIKEAIESSETIKINLETLHSQKVFTDFVVLRGSEAPHSRFGGYESKGRIFFKENFLQALAQYQPKVSPFPDDIRPNNTAFAIAHLLHHVRTPIDMSKFSNPFEYAKANIAVEAESFLIAWNAMVDAAEVSNSNKPLTNRQLGQLLLNSRYPFPFLGKTSTGETLKWLPDGRFAVDPNNVRIVAEVVSRSNIVDLK